MLALKAEQYQHRDLLRALRLCAWSPLAAMGADVQPSDLYSLEDDEVESVEEPDWDYNKVMEAGVGLLDNIEAGGL